MDRAWDGEQIDGPDGHMWVRRDAAMQWRDRALAAEAERTDLRSAITTGSSDAFEHLEQAASYCDHDWQPVDPYSSLTLYCTKCRELNRA